MYSFYYCCWLGTELIFKPRTWSASWSWHGRESANIWCWRPCPFFLMWTTVCKLAHFSFFLLPDNSENDISMTSLLARILLFTHFSFLVLGWLFYAVVSFCPAACILSVLLGAREQSLGIIQIFQFFPAFPLYRELFSHFSFFLIMESFIKQAKDPLVAQRICQLMKQSCLSGFLWGNLSHSQVHRYNMSVFT